MAGRSEITFQLLDGTQAAAHATELQAQNAFRKWGWRKVARTQDDGPGSPVSDVLIMTLHEGDSAR